MAPRGFPGLESMPNPFTGSLTIGTPAPVARPHEFRFSGRSEQEDLLSGGLTLCYVPQRHSLSVMDKAFHKAYGVGLNKIACGP
jgi:hypothetical protein